MASRSMVSRRRTGTWTGEGAVITTTLALLWCDLPAPGSCPAAVLFLFLFARVVGCAVPDLELLAYAHYQDITRDAGVSHEVIAKGDSPLRVFLDGPD